MSRFLSKTAVIRLHDYFVRRLGGLPGIRDASLLDSAAHAPRFLRQYQGADVFLQAAGLFCALARNHAFLDGNKRTAFAAMDVFLRRRGYRLRFEAEAWVEILVAAAQGSLSREGLADALRRAPRR
jgi:death-on-curing protein